MSEEMAPQDLAHDSMTPQVLTLDSTTPQCKQNAPKRKRERQKANAQMRARMANAQTSRTGTVPCNSAQSHGKSRQAKNTSARGFELCPHATGHGGKANPAVNICGLGDTRNCI
jgi:hypothetical protein